MKLPSNKNYGLA